MPMHISSVYQMKPKMPHISIFLVCLLSLIIAEFSFISVTNGFVMKMIPIDSPHLKIHQYNSVHQERHQFLANISLSRVLDHQTKLKRVKPDYFKQTMSRFRNGYFVTQLFFGEGPGSYSPYLVVDTGTDVTWVQCQNCYPCFELKGPSFAYNISTSYAPLDVHDGMCFPPVFNYQGACGLALKYNNGLTNVTGRLGKETFRFLNSTTGALDSYPGLVFGCGLKNVNVHFGLVDGPENQIVGMFGLAASTPLSFVNQLSDQIQGRFSYCIPPFDPVVMGKSTINFGYDAKISGDAMKNAKTIAMHSGEKYFLYLTGVSIDGQRLAIDPYYFGPGNNYDVGLFIDSGSPYTVLPEAIYNPLRDEIVKFFSDKFKWVPKDPQALFELCYPLSDYHQREVPTIILHFWNIDQTEEVDMILDKDRLFQDLSDEFDRKGFCFMVLKVEGPAPIYLGAFQQVNYKFLYDINNAALTFVPQDCHEEN